MNEKKKCYFIIGNVSTSAYITCDLRNNFWDQKYLTPFVPKTKHTFLLV